MSCWAAAGRSGSRFDEFAAIQQFYFDQDMTALGVRSRPLQPRAHAYIGQVIALVDRAAGPRRGLSAGRSCLLPGGAAAAAVDWTASVALRLAGGIR